MPSPPRWRPAPPESYDQLVALDAHRVLQLERLDRRVERVAHADVHAGRPGPVGAGALAAADRLVVGPVAAADDQVVHRPLALRGEPVDELGEREQHGVGDALAGLHVAGHDRRRALRAQQRALRHADVERREGAGVGRHVGREQDAQREQAGGARDRDRAVDVAGDGVGRAVEVDHQLVAGDLHAHADRDVGVLDAVALDLALRRRRAVGQLVAACRACGAPCSRSPRRTRRRSPRRRAARSARPAAARPAGWRRSAPAGHRAGPPACARWPGSGRARRRRTRPPAAAAAAGSRAPPGTARASRRASSRDSSRRRPSGAPG